MAFSQNTYQLTGKVIADDLSALSNASVFVSQFSSGTYTDSLGRFKLSIKGGWNEIAFSYIGYHAEKLNLFISRDTVIEVKLKTNLELGEVSVIDRKQVLQALHDASGVITLRRENF
ncbi:MAG TPA: carboxypeptidase-like regulatory domain-containing protein, partial [Chitinophagales bacterium]|nr:carboxypeptidase-like regulatory domain-containing protein [Chitinophagales bacterium]